MDSFNFLSLLPATNGNPESAGEVTEMEPCHRSEGRPVAGFSPQISGFDLSVYHIGFLVDKVTLRQGSPHTSYPSTKEPHSSVIRDG
jgi:hypothetical protein